jgi:hypothetical protein
MYTVSTWLRFISYKRWDVAETTENWDYCQIDFYVIDDGRDAGRGGLKLMWLQFYARAQGPQGSYTAGKADKIPLGNMMGAATFAPAQGNIGHTNTLQNFLAKLQTEGWQLLPGTVGEWWQRRLRRPSRARPPSLIQKILNLFQTS